MYKFGLNRSMNNDTTAQSGFHIHVQQIGKK